MQRIELIRYSFLAPNLAKANQQDSMKEGCLQTCLERRQLFPHSALCRRVVADRFTVDSSVQESSPIRETRNGMLNTREVKRSIPFGLESLGSDIFTTIPPGNKCGPKSATKT